MSRYYDYSNGISWQNQNLSPAGIGVGAQKESGRGPQPSSMYQHSDLPLYMAGAPNSRVNPLPTRPNVATAPQLYSQSMYHQFQNSKAPPAAIPSHPVLPDVKMKRLPFYDVLAEITKPTSLQPTTAQRLQETLFSFYLTPQQATDIATSRDHVGPGGKLDFIVQVQLRFCMVETTCEQDDLFPPTCGVKVNGKICSLPNPIPTNKPGVEPKRPPRPVNITSFLKLSPTLANTMTVSWAPDFSRNYALSVTLVRKLTAMQLLNRLKDKGTKHSDYTRSLIKEKLREDLDCEIATTSLRVSLVCPLGKMRMTNPCRPATCLHLQCFDASLFLQMNERKPTWLCPVCDKPALYDVLVVDGYFQDVLNSPRLGADCCEVQLHNDGSWSPHVPKKETETPVQNTKPKVAVVEDDLDVIPLSDGSNSSTGPPAKKVAVSGSSPTTTSSSSAGAGAGGGGAAPPATVDLTSDSEDDLPLKSKSPPPVNNQHDNQQNNYNNDVAAGNGSGVSSSGYRSPPAAAPAPPPAHPPSAAIISLDSPSPPPLPVSPQPAHQAHHWPSPY